MQMKSWNIVFPKKKEVEVVQEAVREPGENEVVIKAEKSLVSAGTEMRCFLGQFDPDTNWSAWVRYPFKPGYCLAGSVVQTGQNADGFQPGDRVVTMQPHVQYAVERSTNLIRIPEGISFTEAAWQPLGVITQIGVRRASLMLGESVGLIGAGTLGQLVVQYLRLSGTRKIIAIDANASRLELAEKNGATDCLNMLAADAIPYVKKLTAERMLDVVFDVTGLPTILSSATQMVRRMGRVVLLGDNTMPSKQLLGPNVVSDSISILGAHGSLCPSVGSEFNPWTWKEMAGLFFDYLKEKRLDTQSLTGALYSPMDAIQVYSNLDSSKSGTLGLVFDWSLLDKDNHK
jgi:2-desacetyl-2-hydroxyethyl bacteriochlorophyllide A dehydrogenase